MTTQTAPLTTQMLAHRPETLAGLAAVDRRWAQYRQGQIPAPTVVTQASAAGATPNWDVVISGGTLGILLGAALVQRGWRVALVEKGPLRGRAQEWNISRQEMQQLLQLGLLTAAELDQAIASEYNPARVQFGEGEPIWVRDVLNVGVDPVFLLETLKQGFLKAGGTLLEHTALTGVTQHPDVVTLHTEAGEPLTSRLLVDAMGHFSPIAAQVRQGRKPDGVCPGGGHLRHGLSPE
jgi:lycopene cyclase CruP